MSIKTRLLVTAARWRFLSKLKSSRLGGSRLRFAR